MLGMLATASALALADDAEGASTPAPPPPASPPEAPAATDAPPLPPSVAAAGPTLSPPADRKGACCQGHGGACAHGAFPLESLGNEMLQPVVLIQAWGTALDQDVDPQADASGYGDAEDDPGVKLKRLRLGAEGGHRGVSWKLVAGVDAPYDGLDRDDDAFVVEDAKLGWAPVPWLGAELGKGKVPFSRDQLMSAGELTFTERGFTAEYGAPDRALGASVHVQRWGGKATVGVFNSGGDLFGDDTGGKTVAARLEYASGTADPYATWGEDPRALGVGVGVSGYSREALSTRTAAAGADAMVHAAGISLLVDGSLSVISPANSTVASPEVLAPTQRITATAELSYAAWKFQPAVRWTALVDDSLGTHHQVLGGLAFHGYHDHLRIGAAYVLRVEDVSPVENDTVRLWAQFRI